MAFPSQGSRTLSVALTGPPGCTLGSANRVASIQVNGPIRSPLADLRQRVAACDVDGARFDGYEGKMRTCSIRRVLRVRSATSPYDGCNARDARPWRLFERTQSGLHLPPGPVKYKLKHVHPR